MRGVDLNTVRELLEHADRKMTLRYAHLAPEAKMKAVEMLDAKFMWKDFDINKMISVRPFEAQRIRMGEEKQEWLFSIVDAVSILAESVDGRKYWNKLKQRLKEEGNETVTNCHQLKLKATDGKTRLISRKY